MAVIIGGFDLKIPRGCGIPIPYFLQFSRLWKIMRKWKYGISMGMSWELSWGVVVNIRLRLSLQSALAAWRTNSMLGALSMALPATREGFIPCTQCCAASLAVLSTVLRHLI